MSGCEPWLGQISPRNAAVAAANRPFMLRCGQVEFTADGMVREVAGIDIGEQTSRATQGICAGLFIRAVRDSSRWTSNPTAISKLRRATICRDEDRRAGPIALSRRSSGRSLSLRALPTARTIAARVYLVDGGSCRSRSRDPAALVSLNAAKKTASLLRPVAPKALPTDRRRLTTCDACRFWTQRRQRNDRTQRLLAGKLIYTASSGVCLRVVSAVPYRGQSCPVVH